MLAVGVNEWAGGTCEGNATPGRGPRRAGCLRARPPVSGQAQFQGSSILCLTVHCCPMAIPKHSLSPVPWEEDSFLQVKVEEGEEASLSQGLESSHDHIAHPEAARLRFRHFRYEEASGPHEALAHLRELCCQWLQPEARSKEQILELLVLEQFLGALPPEIQAWVGAQNPKSGEEAAVLVEDLTQVLDKRGWDSGAEPTEASCKQSDLGESEPSNVVTETLMGGVSLGPAFNKACEPEGSSERRSGPSGEMWTKSIAQQIHFKKTSGPYKDAPTDQHGRESGASRNSSSACPNLTSQEKAPSEDKFDLLSPDGSLADPHHGTAVTGNRPSGHSTASSWRLNI
ncbi:hypothetical protein H8959_005327 [Pygathrix nigripes]